MAKAKAPTKAEVKAAEEAVTVEWLPIIKLWSVQLAGLLTLLAGAYAATPALQDMIPATYFAAFMSVSNAVLIWLRTVKQADTT